MLENRLRIYYFLWAIIGLSFLFVTIYLSIRGFTLNIILELIIVTIVCNIFAKNIKIGFYLIVIASLFKFLTLEGYCSFHSTVVCERNLIILSSSMLIFFLTFWISIFICRLLISGLSRHQK